MIFLRTELWQQLWEMTMLTNKINPVYIAPIFSMRQLQHRSF